MRRLIAVFLLHVSLFHSRTSGFVPRASENFPRTLDKHRGTQTKMGIDVSALRLAPTSEGLLNAAASSTGVWADASNALIIVGGLAYFAYEKRPRGSVRDDLIEMRKSTIPTANFGAFSKKFIPAGTVVGRYPGYLRSMEDALGSKESDEARKAAQSYFFSVDDEKVLDPTNTKGELDATLPFLGFLSVDTLMARVNEPPLGGDVNLRTDIVAGGVTVIAERNIFTDEELFMDYGAAYDRSNYIMPTPDEEILETATQRAMKIVKLDVFENAATPDVEEATDSMVRKRSPTVPTTISTNSASMFDALIGSKDAMLSKDDPATDGFAPSAMNSQGILMGASDGFEDKKGEITDAPQYRPALSVQESEQLLRSLDEMTDAEVAAVLSKLKSAVGERIKSEVSEALFNSMGTGGSPVPKDPVEIKKMPRAPPVDPEMRQKYKKELDAIENELDKIYSDPLGVWQEFMANPEKFLNENETGLADDEDLQ